MAKGAHPLEGFLRGILDEVLRIADRVPTLRRLRCGDVDDGGAALRGYADRVRAAFEKSDERMPRVAAEYVSPAGRVYHAHSEARDPASLAPDFRVIARQRLSDIASNEPLTDPDGLPRRHHLGCAEIGALEAAYRAV